MTHNTFGFLCERLGPYLKKQNTQFRVTVPVQDMIAISLHRLESGDGLQTICDLYGVHKSTLSIVARESFRAVRKQLQPIFVQTPSESQFRVFSLKFEKLYGIPYSIGAEDGSHIHVLAPLIGGQYYHCKNHFTQQFYKELSDQIVCFGIMSSGGHEVLTTGAYFKLQESDVDVWKVNFSRINL